MPHPLQPASRSEGIALVVVPLVVPLGAPSADGGESARVCLVPQHSKTRTNSSYTGTACSSVFGDEGAHVLPVPQVLEVPLVWGKRHTSMDLLFQYAPAQSTWQARCIYITCTYRHGPKTGRLASESRARAT